MSFEWNNTIEYQENLTLSKDDGDLKVQKIAQQIQQSKAYIKYEEQIDKQYDEADTEDRFQSNQNSGDLLEQLLDAWYAENVDELFTNIEAYKIRLYGKDALELYYFTLLNIFYGNI